MKSNACVQAGDESRHLVSSRLQPIHRQLSQAVPVTIYILLSIKRSRTRPRDLRTLQLTTTSSWKQQRHLPRPSTPGCVNPTTWTARDDPSFSSSSSTASALRQLPSAVRTATPAFDVQSSGLFCGRPGGLELVTRRYIQMLEKNFFCPTCYSSME